MATSSMNAFYFEKYGKDMTFGTVPKPKVTDPTHVLVKIHAASLNPIDYKVRDGIFSKSLEIAVYIFFD
jgi:NADPH:quinone reductase-like Zn-dependent oxidoreductase